MRQPKLAGSRFGSFFLGGYCVFIKSQKKKVTIKYSKVTCCFLHSQTGFKLLQAGTRTQQVLLILIQDEDFNARHDITVFACATSLGFIPFSFALTGMILRDTIWSLFWLGCFDPCLNYFPACLLNLRHENIH